MTQICPKTSIASNAAVVSGRVLRQAKIPKEDWLASEAHSFPCVRGMDFMVNVYEFILWSILVVNKKNGLGSLSQITVSSLHLSPQYGENNADLPYRVVGNIATRCL